MCGICAIYSTSLNEIELDVFRRLLWVNAWRGFDSTGVVRLAKANKVSSLRMVTDSPRFIKSDKGKDFLDHKHSPTLMIGHCRAATKGAVIAKNVHPFSFANVIGVHNGTIDGDFDHRAEYGTDSEALYRNINDLGLKEGIETSLQYHNFGAYALAFINRQDQTLNFITNGKRPLHFAYMSGTQTLLCSSTREMLEYVADFSKVKLTGWGAAPKDQVWTLNDNDLFTIKIGEPASSGKLTHINIKPKDAPKKSHSFPNYASGYGLGRINQSNSMFNSYNLYGDYEDSWESDPDTASGRTPAAAQEASTGKAVQVYNGHRTGFVGTKADKALDQIYIRQADGQFRTRRQEAARLEAEFKKNAVGAGANTATTSSTSVSLPAGSEEIDETEDTVDDLTHLSWLQAADPKKIGPKGQSLIDEMLTKVVLNGKTGSKSDANRPKTLEAAKSALACGCINCRKVIPLTNMKELRRVRWWNPQSFACGDCYENSPGDWVKCSIEDDWTVGGTYPIEVIDYTKDDQKHVLN